MTDAETAAFLAKEAGQMLVFLRAQNIADGADATTIGRTGDAQANALICKYLAQHRPDDGLFSEEVNDCQSRLAKSRVWIIDPLDGTREYSEGRSDWAVHIALAIDGVASIGAVALPDLGLLLRSDAPNPLPPMAQTPRMVVSRSRPPAQAIAVADNIGAQVIPMGSAGAKAMAIVRGTAEIYLHNGGQHQWDSAAPVAVAAAYGLHCSRIDGSPLIYNKADSYMPDLLICRRELAETTLRLVRDL
jgi:3'(2'), 5'-bisphosphate nucleotidase